MTSGERIVRDHCNIRCSFATSVSAAKGIPLADALRDFTDLHRRFTGMLPGESWMADDIWQSFIRRIADIGASPGIVDCAVEFAMSAHRRSVPSTSPYWPFRYDYDEPDRTVRLHFARLMMMPEAEPASIRLLSRQRLPELRQQLTSMFLEIRLKHPDAINVRGHSWLYNREAYRRLYPPSFTATHDIAKGGFQGGSRWGQFHATRGVNTDLRDVFFRKLAQLDPDHLEDVFPIQTLSVRTSIAAFRAEYGIA